VKDGQVFEVVGCARFRECRFRERGATGPVNKGVIIVKRTGKTRMPVPRVMTCFHILGMQPNLRANSGSVRIEANEGQNWAYMPRQEFRDIPQPTGGIQRVFEQKVEEGIIPKFPRPKENTLLLNDAMRAAIVRDEQERVEDMEYREALGVNFKDDVPAQSKNKGETPRPPA
jgi:hypothetical protein